MTVIHEGDKVFEYVRDLIERYEKGDIFVQIRQFHPLNRLEITDMDNQFVIDVSRRSLEESKEDVFATGDTAMALLADFDTKIEEVVLKEMQTNASFDYENPEIPSFGSFEIRTKVWHIDSLRKYVKHKFRMLKLKLFK